MKKYILFTIAVIISVTCQAYYIDKCSKKTTLLRDKYIPLQHANSEADKKKFYIDFYKEFPDNFYCFNSIYGYDNSRGYGPLAGESYDHVTAFFKGHYISDTLKLKKAINIGINGKWDSDGVSELQYLTIMLVRKNIALADFLLLMHSDDEIESFWYFYLDGPHPTVKTPTLEAYETLSNKNLRLLKKSYELVIENNK